MLDINPRVLGDSGQGLYHSFLTSMLARTGAVRAEMAVPRCASAWLLQALVTYTLAMLRSLL